MPVSAPLRAGTVVRGVMRDVRDTVPPVAHDELGLVGEEAHVCHHFGLVVQDVDLLVEPPLICGERRGRKGRFSFSLVPGQAGRRAVAWVWTYVL